MATIEAKITQINRYTTKKDGTPLTTKDGRPYTSVRIKTDVTNDDILSGFESAETKNWQVGSDIEIEVEKKGEYVNFKVPKKEDKANEKLELILNKLTGIQLEIGRLTDALLPQAKAKKQIESYDDTYSPDIEPPF